MKKKKVKVYMPKAQEGMEMQQPQGQPQGGGGDQMQQLAQQVQQMMQQGAAPEQVVAQLLQGGVPPEAIMQVMVQLGMPQEQVQPLIEGVMQQMQGGQPQGQEATPEGQPMMQDGGEAEQQEQIMQLIQMFAQIQGVDPNQIMEQLQGASPEEQQQMMQQMVQTVQESQGGGQGQSQQPMMFHGGVTTSNPGSFVSPNKADFKEVRKQMMKKFKGGGQTTELDTSSTEALVQNLAGTISNWVAKNHKMGLVNKRYDQVMELFDELPKAQGGMSDEELKAQEAYNAERKVIVDGYADTSYEDLLAEYNSGKIDAGLFADITRSYHSDKMTKDKTDDSADESTDTNNTNTNVPIGTVYGNSVWNGQEWTPIGQGFMGAPNPYYGQPQHYYQGWGPGMPQTYPWQQTFDKRPMGQMIGAFGAPGSGGYKMTGIGGLKGQRVPQLNAQLAQVMSNPQMYGANIDYIPRFLRKDKIRITWDPITGEPKEEGSAQGATKTMAQVTNEDGTVRTMSLEEAFNQGLSHSEVEVPVTQDSSVGMQDYPGTGNILEVNPRTGQEEYISSEAKAERWQKRNRRKFENIPKKQHGGVTRSNPGGLIWDFDKMKFTKGPQSALFQAEMGVDLKAKRSFDGNQFYEGLYSFAQKHNPKLTAARLNTPSWDATDMRSTDNTQQVYEPGSGARGFYDQEGRFIPSDIGGKVMPGTGTDPEVFGSYQNRNFYQDMIPGQGMKYMQSGGLVGDVSFTQDELDELASLGYDISRL